MSSVKNYPTSLSVPLNRTAARVISKGTHYIPPKKNNTREYWETPPPLVTSVTEAVKSLFGTRKGSLTVIGYLGSSSSGSARLLVRCDCGKYEVRLSNRWRKHSGINNYCQFCEYTQKLKFAHLSDGEKRAERERTEKLKRD
jgi:hypothetical protein